MPPRLPRNTKADEKPYTAACLFAGMGGFADGFIKEGFKISWANEIDKHAAASFRANYPDAELIERDVKNLSVKKDKLPPVDVLTAGFPCQSFSITGKKDGFNDERGELFFDIIRIVDEFGKKKPKILLLENVPNIMGGNSGKWFEQIIHSMQRAGYWFDRMSCQILNTSEITQVPQNRKRLFMVGVSTAHYKHNGYEFPPASGKTLDLQKFINRKKIADNAEYLNEGSKYHRLITEAMEKGSRSSIYQLRRFVVREKPSVCPTLTANMGGGGHNVPFIFDQRGIRRLSINECLKLQGFDNYQFPVNVPNSERYKQIGNAVSAPVAKELAKSCKIILCESKT